MFEARAAAAAIPTADDDAHPSLGAQNSALGRVLPSVHEELDLQAAPRRVPALDPALAEIHDLLVETRDSRYAHTERDGGREATFEPASVWASRPCNGFALCPLSAAPRS